MRRILVIADDSILGDAIELTLSEEIEVEMLRLTHHELANVPQRFHEYSPDVIIFAGTLSEAELAAVDDLLEDDGQLLVITVSPEKRYLQICETTPVTGMAQVVNLVRNYLNTH